MGSATMARGGVDARVAIGLGTFAAWQQGLLTSTFLYSSGLLVSPTTLLFLAGCLVFVAMARAMKSRSLLSQPKVRLAVLAVSLIAGTLLAAFAARFDLLWMRYLTSVVMGVSAALMLYAWANELSHIEHEGRLPSVLAGLTLSGVAQFAQMTTGGPIALTLNSLYAVASWAALALGPRNELATNVTFRPSGQTHFKMPMVGFVVLAAMFGFVIGTSSQAPVPEGGREFAEHISVSLAGISAVLLIVKVLVAKPVSLPAVMRFLAPAMALLFLADILFGNIGGWLPCITLGLWQIIQMLAVLVMVDLAQSGYASMSLVFPVGWSLVCLGQGIGAFAGQATSIFLGSSDAVVQFVSVVQCIVAVTGATLLTAGQYPLGSPKSVEPEAPRSEPAPNPEPSPAAVPENPTALAIAAIAKAHNLSEREMQVMELLASGNTRMGVAEKLVISENTVRVHVKNIYGKLGIHSKQQLVDMVDRKAHLSE